MPSLLSVARALPLAVALLVTGAAVATPGYADESGAWSVAPSAGGGTRPAKDGRPYFYVEGTPGSVLEDTVTVTNPGSKPRTIELTGADADNTRGGAFSLGRGKPTDTGSWITFARREVKVPPRTRAEVPFSVSVPEDAIPGDHPGAIVARGGGRDAGVRVHLRVSGPTLSALTVEKVKAEGSRITYDIVNRGNTVLTPKLAVRADGLFGTLLDRPARPLPIELLPGRRVTLTEPWQDAPSLDSADVTLTVTAAGDARDEASASVRFVPWGWVAGVGAALLGLAGAAFWFVRRRRGPVGEPPPDELEQSSAERELTSAGTGRGEQL
ncbi:WxL protein peptidoglycan domain-containing protein [Streptomyces sp. NPDC059037]|uniref:WxL protein peptidoglycan domain-containing protein n=1 Tax=Streptomyces sp. NPDC059037 TaxID=3346710 RepID=UPI00368CA52D